MFAVRVDRLLVSVAIVLLLLAAVGALAEPLGGEHVDAATPAPVGSAEPAPSPNPDNPIGADAVPATAPLAATPVAPTVVDADAPIAEQLQNLVNAKFDGIIGNKQDRIIIEAFYSGRNYAPLW